MRWLAERRLAVSADGPGGVHRQSRATCPDGSVVVSVDDGYRDFLTEALPIMRTPRHPGHLLRAGRRDRQRRPGSERAPTSASPGADLATLTGGRHRHQARTHYEHRSLGGMMSRADAYEQARSSAPSSSVTRATRRGVRLSVTAPARTTTMRTRVALRRRGYAHAFVTPAWSDRAWMRPSHDSAREGGRWRGALDVPAHRARRARCMGADRPDVVVAAEGRAPCRRQRVSRRPVVRALPSSRSVTPIAGATMP